MKNNVKSAKFLELHEKIPHQKNLNTDHAKFSQDSFQVCGRHSQGVSGILIFFHI